MPRALPPIDVPEELQDYDTPVPVDKDGNPKPKEQEKRKPKRGSDPKAPKIVAARVQRIAMVMASGGWGYPAAYALAMEWGLKVSTVQQYAVLAAMLNDMVVGSSKVLEATMLATLGTVIQRSMDAKQYRVVVEAVKVMAGLKGLDKSHQDAKQNTMAIVGVDELLAARVMAAAAANAAPEAGPPAAAPDETTDGRGG